MKLPKLAIENHQFTLIVITLLVLSGIVSLINMPRSEDPKIHPAGSNVVVIYPGANPADMEELIIDPVEEAINELDDIKQLVSTAEDGLATIAVEFESGSNPDEKYSDVIQKVNSIRNRLPEEILSLETRKWEVSDVNILQIALISGCAPYRELEKEAERLKTDLEKVTGVRKVEIMACPEQEIRVSVNQDKLAGHRIPLPQVMGAIRSANRNIPGGNVDIGSRRFNIQTSGSFANIDDIRNVVVSAGNSQVVRLRDVAEVEQRHEDKNYYARVNGRRAIFITVKQKEGTNIFDITGDVKRNLAGFREDLPANTSLEIVFDQSQSVAHRVNGFFINLLQGLLLVGIVVFLAVGLRASVIVMLAIPVSILIAVGFIDLSDYGLQQMTIAGLVIALGLLVDNAIVVTENISRFMQKGIPDEEAAARGTQQVAWAIVSATATTILAFIPMLMIRHHTGEFIRSMPVTVIYTLAASLLISLVMTPYLASRFLKSGKGFREGKIRQLLNRLIENHYRGMLKKALHHPGWVISVSVLIFLASLGLFMLVGVSFFPKAEKAQFLINVNTPNGSSLDKTDRVTAFVESVLQNENQITHFVSNIGHGNPRIYYNIFPENEKSTHAQIFVELAHYDPQKFDAFIARLRQKLSGYPGAEIEVKELEQGPPVEAPIAIRVLGENLEMLKKIGGDVERLIAGTPGTINTNNPLRTSRTDLQVRINRTKAGLLGIPLEDIDRTVRLSIAGLPVSSYRDAEGREYDIVVRLPVKDKPAMSDFNHIYLQAATGGQVPLQQLAAVQFKSSPMLIDHYNLERNVTVTADVVGGYSVNNVTRQIIDKLQNYDWPRGYRYSVGGELESRQESFGGMARAVVIAMIAIFAVLVLQFRSYTQPLIVFSAIPLAVVGSVLALLITGNSFSFTAFVGLTSLVGIVVNNSIILVDYTNQLQREGRGLLAALQEAGETRFIPIILTTLTTVGGLLPLTLGGGSLWAPMGWTIIGGLLVSTFLTLIVVPVLYKIFTHT